MTKKYPSLKEELIALNNELILKPDLGTPLGNNTYKVRLAIKSKGKGKSGGARVITYFITQDATVFLLTIYDKSEIENVDDQTIREIIDNLVDFQ